MMNVSQTRVDDDNALRVWRAKDTMGLVLCSSLSLSLCLFLAVSVAVSLRVPPPPSLFAFVSLQMVMSNNRMKIVKKRSKPFNRMHQDRYKCLKVRHTSFRLVCLVSPFPLP